MTYLFPPPRTGYAPLFLAPATPWMLHSHAASVGVLPCLFYGAFTTLLAIVLALCNVMGLGPEPLLYAFGMLAFLVMLVVPFVFTFIPAHVWIRISYRTRAKACAILLTPSTLLPPLTVWMILIELARFPTSPLWLLGLAVAAVANLAVALRRIDGMTFTDDGDVCLACHYPRRGLAADAPCPECGRRAV